MRIGKARAANRSRWQSLLAELENSGMKLDAFAKKRGINPQQLARWKVKLASERQVAHSRFVDVAVIPENRAMSQVALRLPNGMALEFSAPPPAEWLAAFVRSLS